MKKFSWMLIIVLIIAFPGCAYVNVKTPYDTDLNKTVLGDKVGEASIYSILWIVAWGDASTAAAALNGKISVINHMDRQSVSILLGLYCKNTTIVYGD
ncbi:MAG: TRL-like family protein [Proteobacteria bacterium]|nr:TRL-like family protein [Pseudomonadota bacterium]